MERTRKKGRIGKALKLATLLFGTTIPTDSIEIKDANLFQDSTIGVEIEGRQMDVPMYSLKRVRPGRCSAYARMAAEDIFGEKYSYSDGWDRRYNDSVVTSVESNQDLERLEKEGTLRPGMMIGAYYPGSPYLGKTDNHGHKVEYTHNFLYLGRDNNGKLTFVSQEKHKTLVKRLDELAKTGIEAREVITPRNQ